MSKLLNFAGVSRVAGELKFRTATEPSRFQQLTKLGDTDVEMLYLGSEMTKSQAAKELLAMGYKSKDNAVVDFITQYAKDDNPFKKSARVVKIRVPNSAIAQLTGAKVEVVNEYTHGTAKERREANKRLMAQYEEQMSK